MSNTYYASGKRIAESLAGVMQARAYLKQQYSPMQPGHQEAFQAYLALTSALVTLEMMAERMNLEVECSAS